MAGWFWLPAIHNRLSVFLIACLSYGVDSRLRFCPQVVLYLRPKNQTLLGLVGVILPGWGEAPYAPAHFFWFPRFCGSPGGRVHRPCAGAFFDGFSTGVFFKDLFKDSL